MKEEMARLFDLRDEDEARNGWTAWFEGAKASGIPALMRFAELKEKRIDGLIAHASHPISTGKLEGFNNRIKVAKRIAYGYRDEDYFFSLIQFLSIPSVRDQSAYGYRDEDYFFSLIQFLSIPSVRDQSHRKT